MKTFILSYTGFAIIVFIWLYCDTKYYELKDTIKYYNEIDNHIDSINTALLSVNTNDEKNYLRLVDKRTYWQTLKKNKSKVKWLLRFKKYR